MYWLTPGGCLAPVARSGPFRGVGDPQACRPRALSNLAQLTIYFLAVDGLSAASDETEQIRSEFALSNFLTKKNAFSKGMCL